MILPEYFFYLILCLNCLVVQSFLNIEELQEMRYSLDILQRPINSAEMDFSAGLQLSSKHGQQYYCKLPSTVLQMEKQLANEDKLPADYPIPNLLEPLKTQPCLKIVKGWWTYEFCYMKNLQQYHSEDGRPAGDIIDLGKHESDFDWSNEQSIKSKMFKKKRIQKYHSQYYVNGTECNVINHKRDTEVRFYCDETATTPYIERVDEPSTCSYILTIKTNLICSHPYTKISSKSKPVEILCQPVLSPDSYRSYSDQRTKMELAAYEKANLLLRQKRDQLREVLMNVKTHTDVDDDEEYKVASENKEVEFDKEKMEDQDASKTELNVREIAIGFIQRFVLEDKFLEYSPEVQNELLEFVEGLVMQFKNLPSADLARLVRFEILGFIERRDTSSSFIETLLRGISPSGEVKQTNMGSVHIKVRQLNGDFVDDDITQQDPSLKELEEEIENELVEAGITSKRSIEVHLITANKNSGKLTETDVNHFKEALIEIMGGGAVEEREKEKFKKLSDNYSLLYKDSDSQFILTRNNDEDEANS